MSVGVFIDKKHQPSETEISQTIGKMLPVWQELIQFIREKYPSEEDFKFMYGKKYGWARRFRMRSQFLTNLYPSAGEFTVQINLSQEAVEKAHPYPEGRWLFIPIQASEDIQDIHPLLALRVETKGLKKK